MKKTEIFILLIILISFAIGWYLYPLLPERVASHWNAKGEVDGHMPKAMPVIFTAFYTIIYSYFAYRKVIKT